MDHDAMEAVIRDALVCRLAMADQHGPYVVPMSFGYEDGVLYFHGGAQGRKARILKENPRVCVEFDVDAEIVVGDDVCRATMRYRSVIAFGRAAFISDPEDKRRALAALVRHYGREGAELPDEAVRRTTCFKVEIDSMTGRQSG